MYFRSAKKETVDKMSVFTRVVYKIGYKVYDLLGFSKNTLDVQAFEKQKEFISEKQAKIIFDIGARHGGITMQYREMYPKAKIYSFEPFPKSYNELLKKIVNDKENIIPVNLGISDKSGKTNFYVNEHDFTNSLLPSHPSETMVDNMTANKTQIEITTTTIDEFAEHNNIDRINILKFDIQGGELKALNGAKKMLSENRISLIYTEVLFMKMYEGQPYYHDISAFLYNHGYELINIFNPWYIDGRLAWADALFVNSKSMKK